MKAIIAIGLPGCGKTTLLKPLAEKLAMGYVNADDIRRELTGDSRNHTKESQVWTIARQRIAKYLQENGVVIDATHVKPKDRRSMTQFCKEFGAKETIGYWFNIPVELCKQRNKTRDRIVPDMVMEKMHKQLTDYPPLVSDGFTAVYVIIPDTV